MQTKTISTRSITEITLCAALIAVTAMISIPFPVPFTMQLFGVCFSLFFLGGVRGSLSVILYIAIGAVGLPVFSGFSGGFGRLFDATGGFIFGFLLLSIVYSVFERLLKCRASLIIGMAVSLLAFYAIGSFWYFSFYTDGSARAYFASLLTTVVPFIIPDVIKIHLAYLLVERLLRIFGKKRFKSEKNH